MLSEHTGNTFYTHTLLHYYNWLLLGQKESLWRIFSFKTLSLSCLHNETSRLWQKIYVFRWNVFIKCTAFYAADVFGCQSLNYNKLEQFPKSKVQELKSLVPRECQLSGTVLVFVGEVAKIMLQCALSSRVFTTVIKIWKQQKWGDVIALTLFYMVKKFCISKWCKKKKNDLNSLYQVQP